VFTPRENTLILLIPYTISVAAINSHSAWPGSSLIDLAPKDATSLEDSRVKRDIDRPPLCITFARLIQESRERSARKVAERIRRNSDASSPGCRRAMCVRERKERTPERDGCPSWRANRTGDLLSPFRSRFADPELEKAAGSYEGAAHCISPGRHLGRLNCS